MRWALTWSAPSWESSSTTKITEDDQTLTVQAGTRLGSADDIAALPLLGGNTDGLVTIADSENGMSVVW